MAANDSADALSVMLPGGKALKVCCGHCICYQARRADMGVCMAHPPTAVIGPAQQVYAPGQAPALGTAAIWPPVKPDVDYCLEFRPSPHAAETAGANAADDKTH